MALQRRQQRVWELHRASSCSTPARSSPCACGVCTAPSSSPLPGSPTGRAPGRGLDASELDQTQDPTTLAKRRASGRLGGDRHGPSPRRPAPLRRASPRGAPLHPVRPRTAGVGGAGGSRVPSLDLPGAAAEHGDGVAVARDAVDVELRRADHEVDVDAARVEPLPVGLVVTPQLVGVPERDVARGVLVEERLVEDRVERADPALAVDERELAEPGSAVVLRRQRTERVAAAIGVDLTARPPSNSTRIPSIMAP